MIGFLLQGAMLALGFAYSWRADNTEDSIKSAQYAVQGSVWLAGSVGVGAVNAS